MAHSLDFCDSDEETNYCRDLVAQEQYEYFFYGIEGKSKLVFCVALETF